MHFVKKNLEIKPYKIKLLFENSEVCLLNLEDKIKAKSNLQDSIYKKLLDKEYFMTAKVRDFDKTIYWDNGLDFCPDCLYDWSEPYQKETI